MTQFMDSPNRREQLVSPSSSECDTIGIVVGHTTRDPLPFGRSAVLAWCGSSGATAFSLIKF